MRRLIFLVAERCLGCRTCEIECVLAHVGGKTLEEVVGEGGGGMPRVSVDDISGLAVPLHCCQCEAAACVLVCPSRALSRDSATGIVRIDETKCVGCGSCILVCPFGVLQRGSRGTVISKCDLCRERLEKGEYPACVSGCPTGALRLVEVKEDGGR